MQKLLISALFFAIVMTGCGDKNKVDTSNIRDYRPSDEGKYSVAHIPKANRLYMTYTPTETPQIDFEDIPLSNDLIEETLENCATYDVPPELAFSVMEVESNFQTDAVNPSGCYGLMQINDICTDWLSEELGITDLLDPEANIQAGVYILGTYLEKYDSTNKALMAYNLGPSGASTLWKQGIYSTSYTDKVLDKSKDVQH